MSKIKQIERRIYQAVGHWRLLRLFLALIILWGVILPDLGMIQDQKNYKLTAATETLIGSANTNLSDKFDYDAGSDVWQFNKDGSAKQTADLKANAGSDKGAAGAAAAMAQLKAQVGGSGKKDASLYSVDLAGDATKGVTYYDNNTQLSFKMTPQFKLQHGKRVQGRVVYPFAGGGQLVYTAKTDGLKEDIVLKKNIGNSLSYSYKLNLPDTLEARLRDDGSLGIYSGDQSLFGNVSYGTPEDQAKVEEARKNANKTSLVFAIPAPVVKDGKGRQANSIYKLQDGMLTVAVNGLDKLSYPLTVDPSVVITSSSDFQTGNNEGGIDYSTSDEIDRGEITGGTTGTWATTTPFTTARYGSASVVYNGYMYVIGGGSTLLNDVQYAPINADGTVGTWTATTAFPTARYYHTAVAYNGYMYIMGGNNSTPTMLNDVQYAPINADGTVGTWTATTSFTTGRTYHAAVVYNGYVYIMGGQDASGNILNDTQYAPINANGTLGAWTTTTAFATGRYQHAVVAYNGYMYVLGGQDASGNILNDTQYAPIKANGTVGTWATTTSFSPGRYGLTSVVYNGYVYVIGGYGGGFRNDLQYAPINANGTVGTWTTTTTFATGRYSHASVAYNGYVYVIGGYGGGFRNDVQYAKIDDAGVIGTTSFATTTSLTTARTDHTSVVYNGYMYVLGGKNTGSTYYATVQYALINADGTLGAWTTTTALTTARYGNTTVAYNGYMYVLGGFSGSGGTVTTVQYALINADGTLGAWTTTTAFTTARNGHTSVAYNGYMYVLGGNNVSVLSDVQYAPINANGTLGTWATTTSLTVGRSSYATVTHNGYMYVLGGTSTSSSIINTVQYAPINANGTLGAWTTTTAFATGRYGHTSVVYNGYIYVMGGYGSGYHNDVQYAPINANGTIGTWATTTTFTNARYLHTSVVYNGYMYVLGGTTGTLQSDVQYAPLNVGGSGATNTWATTTAFTTIRAGHTSVVYNGYLYVIGGTGTSSGGLNDVQYAPINANGTVGAWTTTTAFTTARSYHTSVVYNGYLYVMGGSGSAYFNDVQYAPINANGTVGAWITTTAFTTARTGHTSVVYNGYLYVIGGYTGSAYLNTVQYALINANGTIGTWATTTAFTTARSYHTSVVYNGYLYVMGGLGSTVSATTVQYAPINANGTIGTWTTSATTFTTGRYGHTSVIYNGYLYVIGGNGGGFKNDVQYASLVITPRVANYSKLIAFSNTSGLYYLSSVIYNSLVNANSSVTYKTAGANGVLGTVPYIAGTGTGTVPSTCSTGGGAQYIFVSVKLDDTGTFTWGGKNPGKITDITVNYQAARPPTELRLFGGKSFYNELQQPLDTCGPSDTEDPSGEQ